MPILALSIAFLITYGYGVWDYSTVGKKLDQVKYADRLFTSSESVGTKIKAMSKPPEMVITDKPVAQVLIEYLLRAGKNENNFYAKKVLTSLPKSLKYASKPISNSLVLIDNTLLIQSIEKADVETISPTLGKLMVKDYFGSRYIKDEPTVAVLGRQEYLEYREDQINEQVGKIQVLIDQVQKNIAAATSNLSGARSRLANAQAGLGRADSDSASDDKICKTAMDYDINGNLVRYYSDAYCAEIKAYYVNVKAELNKLIGSLQGQVQNYQTQVTQYTEAKKTLDTIKLFISSQKDSTPQELGIFLPEKEKKIALDSTDSKTLATYIVTLTHEYLHYTSYVSKERRLPQFFEERLTEYYARRVVSKELHKNTNIGYPLVVKIIEQMATKVDAKDLEDVYFTKDSDRLVSLLDAAYGKNFYSDSEFYFTAMSYVSSKDALNFANNIMLKIGGRELEEKDLLSEF